MTESEGQSLPLARMLFFPLKTHTLFSLQNNGTDKQRSLCFGIFGMCNVDLSTSPQPKESSLIQETGQHCHQKEQSLYPPPLTCSYLHWTLHCQHKPSCSPSETNKQTKKQTNQLKSHPYYYFSARPIKFCCKFWDYCLEMNSKCFLDAVYKEETWADKQKAAKAPKLWNRYQKWNVNYFNGCNKFS